MNTTDFKQQFLPYSRKMFFIACRLLGNEKDAEDMVQESYLRLWNKREEIGVIHNSEAYIITIVRNTCLDFLRKKKEQMNEITVAESNIASDYTDTDIFENNDELLYVIDIMEHLPPQQKLVMHLRHIEECSMEEIEEKTGLSNINIRTLLSRARKSMRQIYESVNI